MRRKIPREIIEKKINAFWDAGKKEEAVKLMLYLTLDPNVEIVSIMAIKHMLRVVDKFGLEHIINLSESEIRALIRGAIKDAEEECKIALDLKNKGYLEEGLLSALRKMEASWFDEP